MPHVSVIMTVYNGEQFVADAIQSIQQQTLQDFEFIIVDDGSQDRTLEILAGFQTDPRICVVAKPRLGRARALNVAWRQTRAAYIANLDADDLARPSRLEQQLSFLQQHPEVGLLSTDCQYLDEETGTARLVRVPQCDCEMRAELVRRNPITHSSVMMPRTVLENVGGYNETLPVSVDYDLWVRIASVYQVANLPEVLTVRRLRRHSYFHAGELSWPRYKAHLSIRWRAWYHFSRRLPALRYVLLDPTKQLLASAVRRLLPVPTNKAE